MSEQEIERPHHPYSPSSLQSLEACPSYQGRSTTHVRAIAGTMAHKVVETTEDNQKLSDDDAEAAAECLDFVASHLSKMEHARDCEVADLSISLAGDDDHPDSTCLDAEHQTPEVLELREVYLPIDDCNFADAQATTAGYVDHVIISHCGTHAKMFDWKFGMWPVEQAENNLQGIAYSLGLFKKFPALEKIEFFFIQPHLEYITSAVFLRSDIAKHYLRIQTIVARARSARGAGDFSLAAPTVPVCQFCANIGKCPKVAAFALNVGKKFFPLAIPDDITPTAIHNAADSSVGLKLAAVVKTWAESYRAQVTDSIMRSKSPVPDGYTISHRTPREIADTKVFKQVALEYVTQDEYDTGLSVTFGPIEEAISEKAPRGSKKAALESFKAALKDRGATKDGTTYSFLKAVAKSKDKE